MNRLGGGEVGRAGAWVIDSELPQSLCPSVPGMVIGAILAALGSVSGEGGAG